MKGAIKTLLHVAVFVAVIAGIICGILYAFFVDVVEIEHNGMAPTLFAGDQLLVWRDATPEMGDVLVCEHPRDVNRRVFGRLFAKPGMEIEVQRSNIVVAGERSVVDVLDNDLTFYNAVTDRNEQVRYGTRSFGSTDHLYFELASSLSPMRSRTVRNGFFLMGDHRGKRQHDSRGFGVIRPETCQGVVFGRLRASETQRAPAGIDHDNFDIIR